MLSKRIVGFISRIQHVAFLQRSKNTPNNECPKYDAKLHLMMKVESWSFWKCGVISSLPLLPGRL